MSATFDYTIERRSIKHARINVSENKHVKLIVPADFTENDIDTLISNKQQWINKHLKYFTENKPSEVPLADDEILFLGTSCKPEIGTSNSTALLSWYKGKAKEYIIKNVEELSKRHRISYNKIFIRNSTTKWGNCSKDKNLSFYWKLIKTPPFVIEYIILHELCHTLIMSHNQAFWLKLYSICPDYQKAVDWLNEYGKSL